MYFYENSDMTHSTIAPGFDIDVITGEKGQMSFVTLEPGATVPMHDHPHEQMGYIMEGDFDFTIGDETRRVKPGDKYVIPGGVTHGITKVYIRSLALDIFSPPREEYA